MNTVALSLGSREKVEPAQLAESLKKYSNIINNFSDTETHILSILGLHPLNDPQIWIQLISSKEDGRSISYELYSNINFAITYLPKFLVLLKQEGIEYIDGKVQNDSEKWKDKLILTVILTENTSFSSPERLEKTLNSIQNFYSAFAFLSDEDSTDLGVVAIDSGSDKSFDFLGAAKVIEGVKEIIFGLYDRVIFYKEKKLHERLDLIAKSLPILEKIQALEEKLGPEQCELLRRQVIGAAHNFIEAGAVLPEFTERSSFNPKQLMATEPKLLMSANGRTENTQNQSFTKDTEEQIDDDTDEMTEEERSALEKYLKKGRKKKS